MARANLKRLDEGKLYYSISEVCSMTGLEQHVLRYWESEFPQLRPKKNRSGNRAYRNKEIKIIQYIRYLLYEEKYTIPGAKRKMAEANLSDLEGQMSLIRVAPAAPPAPIALPAGNGDRNGGGDSSVIGIGHGNGGHHLPDRHREELVKIKRELQDLLAALLGDRGAGRRSP
jgi:DNA-binding transcriptional MerR regulator